MSNPAQQMNELAQLWTEKNPKLQGRIQRALALVGEVYDMGGCYAVEGVKGDYLVHVHGSRSTCTCEDSQRGNHCKHRIAVALVWTTQHLRDVQQVTDWMMFYFSQVDRGLELGGTRALPWLRVQRAYESLRQDPHNLSRLLGMTKAIEAVQPILDRVPLDELGAGALTWG